MNVTSLENLRCPSGVWAAFEGYLATSLAILQSVERSDAPSLPPDPEPIQVLRAFSDDPEPAARALLRFANNKGWPDLSPADTIALTAFLEGAIDLAGQMQCHETAVLPFPDTSAPAMMVWLFQTWWMDHGLRRFLRDMERGDRRGRYFRTDDGQNQ